MSALAFKSAVQLSHLIKSKEISAVELLDYYIKRISQYNPQINAVVVTDFDRARDQAKKVDENISKGQLDGALLGLPMTIKESFNLVGTPTTHGRSELLNNFPSYDALSVSRLKAAGAIIMGKTNVPYNLADYQSYNSFYGCTNNPWDIRCIPGGSSGGSAAALAAGLSCLEFGSDIGGSVRNPAHFCGVFAHKPTWGIIPPRGHCLPDTLLQYDLSVVGPLSRSAADLDLVLQVASGPDEISSFGMELNLPRPQKKMLSEYKVGVWIDDVIAPVSEDVKKQLLNVAENLEQLGVSVYYDRRPDFNVNEFIDVYETLLWSTMSSRLSKDEYENLCCAATQLSSHDVTEFASSLRKRVANVHDFNHASNRRTYFRWCWHEYFKSVDVLITPIMSRDAFEHDHRDFKDRSVQVDNKKRGYFEQIFWAALASNCYLPATVIPAGLSSNRLPIGLQIIGPEYGDLITIEVAKLLENEGLRFDPPNSFPEIN